MAMVSLEEAEGTDTGFHSWQEISQSSRHSSLSRKLLPSLPDMDQQLELSAKLIDRRTSTAKGNHTHGPFYLEYALTAEYTLLAKQRLTGIFVIPSFHSPLRWHGVLTLGQGLYAGGLMRFQLLIPDNFPDADCPRLYFDAPVYHPLVDARTHELSLRGAFRKWRRNHNHLWQILAYMRSVFLNLDPEALQPLPLNREAAKCYREQKETFETKVAACISSWKSRVFETPAECEDDPHALVFSHLSDETHQRIRQRMINEGRLLLQNESMVGVGESMLTSDLSNSHEVSTNTSNGTKTRKTR